MKNWLNLNWIKFPTIIFLVAVVFVTLPKVSYQFLNWMVLITSVLEIYQWQKKERYIFSWIFVIVAVLFNPFSFILLSETVWRILDVFVVLLLLSSILLSLNDGKYRLTVLKADSENK
jgi:hypothetical protein